jgi:agmatinase
MKSVASLPRFCRAGNFLVSLGGEHSITPPLVEAPASAFKGLSCSRSMLMRISRECYMGTPHNHACAMRRSLEFAPRDTSRHSQHVDGRG